jgi:hypothetical protein
MTRKKDVEHIQPQIRVKHDMSLWDLKIMHKPVLS